MADLLVERNTPRKVSVLDMIFNYLLATSAVVFKGGGVAFDTTGKLVRASAAGAVKTAGRARQSNASAASGDRLDFESGIFQFANGVAALTAADIGNPCYWEDDQTVGGDTSKLFAGVVVDVDSAGVWVAMFPFGAGSLAASNWDKLIAGGAAYTVKPEDDGATVQTATDNAVITLPAIAQENKGMRITVRTTAAAGAAKVSVSPAAADAVVGTISNAAADVHSGGVANKDWINTKATQQPGDFTTFQNDGTHTWYITGGTGIWASEP